MDRQGGDPRPRALNRTPTPNAVSCSLDQALGREHAATFALNFSRPGGQIIAQHYNFLRLGKEGYRKVHQTGYVNAQYLAAAIAKLGPFEIIYGGDGVGDGLLPVVVDAALRLSGVVGSGSRWSWHQTSLAGLWT